MLAYDPIPVLQSVGYTEREAAFLYLVALHSGYFLRRQYGRFIERERGAIAAQLLRKAMARRHLESIACGQARFVYHLTAKEIYDAVGLAASQHRRLKGDAEIKARLMVLDFVLDHLGGSVLDSAEAKTNFFATRLNMSHSQLPRSSRGNGQLFPEKFPILASDPECPQFTFFDEGSLSTSTLENFLRRHRAVFAALPGFELLYLADTNWNFERAGRLFASLYPRARALGMTPMTPRGVDHFLEYLRAFELSESQVQPITLRDLEVLHEGELIYTTLEHRALCAAWKVGSTSTDLIRQRFEQRGPHAKFTAICVPYSYPIYQLKRERSSEGKLGSSEWSMRMPLFQRKAIENALLTKGDE